MPGSLEAVDGILSEIDSGRVGARGDLPIAQRSDHIAQQLSAAGGNALFTAASGEDPGELRVLVPAVH